MQENILLALCIVIIILIFYMFGTIPALLIGCISYFIFLNNTIYKGGNNSDCIYLAHGIKNDAITKFNNILLSECVKSKNFILDKATCDYTIKNKTSIINDKKIFEDEYNPNFNYHVYTNLVTNIKYYLYHKKNMYDMFLIFKIPLSYIKEKYDFNKKLLADTLWKDKYINEHKFPLTLFSNSDVMVFSDYIPIKFLSNVYVTKKDIYDNLDYQNKTYIEDFSYNEIIESYQPADLLKIYQENPALNNNLLTQTDEIKAGILRQLQDYNIKKTMQNIINFCNYH